MRYVRGPIELKVPIPQGYREHLECLEETLGWQRAPYFGPTMHYPSEALTLWEGNRGIEEYAREVFPLEEAANGLTWMEENDDPDAPSETPVHTPRTESDYDFTGSV